MTCKGLAACPAPRCAHRELVVAYHEERERQETEMEDGSQREPSEYDLITFKRWLIAHRREGRHRPEPQSRRRSMTG